MQHSIRALFLDIGGVLATNGWDHPIRQKTCERFGLRMDEMDERHHMLFDTYERGKITLDHYLNTVVFYEPRTFTIGEFKKFMFEASKSFPETLSFFHKLKIHHRLKIVAVSNEGRELNADRIKRFELDSLFDFFASSCYLGVRKPDAAIYQIALDTTQIPVEKTIYIDDRPMLTEAARQLGFNTILHETLEKTKKELATFGLSIKNENEVRK